MTERQYGPEDFLYYGQKVMVNPEADVQNTTEPGEVGIVIDCDIGDGDGVPYALKRSSRIAKWTVIVRWEKSGRSSWQTKNLLAIDEDVVPIKKYQTNHGMLTVIDGQVNKALDQIMIQKEGNVGKILSFNEDKRRKMVARVKNYLEEAPPYESADQELPF